MGARMVVHMVEGMAPAGMALRGMAEGRALAMVRDRDQGRDTVMATGVELGRVYQQERGARPAGDGASIRMARGRWVVRRVRMRMGMSGQLVG
jgi:hypothetical protein